MRKILFAAALAGCAETWDIEQTSSPCDAGPDAAPDAPPDAPPTKAKCNASVALSEPTPGDCRLLVTVDYVCDPATQVHTWARLGYLYDGIVGGTVDLTYTCGGTLSHEFTVPCGPAQYLGGSTFDDPLDQSDISCIEGIP